LPKDKDCVLGYAYGVVLVLCSYLVVDKVFFEEGTHSVGDDFGSLVGSQHLGKESDLCNEAAKCIVEEILGAEEFDVFGSAPAAYEDAEIFCSRCGFDAEFAG
jgi:hypothetical protein